VPLHVSADRTAQVALPRPAVQVGIELTTDEECTRILVDPADASAADGEIASRPCNDPHHGSLERVTSGRYRICNPGSDCAVVDVAPAPARQRATLGRQRIAVQNRPARRPGSTCARCSPARTSRSDWSSPRC
jgi:hypothetical protein